MTRQLIGQAQGFLMERHKVTADQACALLVRASQDRDTKPGRCRRPRRKRAPPITSAAHYQRYHHR